MKAMNRIRSSGDEISGALLDAHVTSGHPPSADPNVPSGKLYWRSARAVGPAGHPTITTLFTAVALSVHGPKQIQNLLKYQIVKSLTNQAL
jgi:hypothetical protein